MNTSTIEDNDDAPGWSAIDRALNQLYPQQKPKHFGTVVPAALGGQDPLNGVSTYLRMDPLPHWHYITYGFSDLFVKESPDPETSGYGFELTFRLACSDDSTEPPTWPIGLLQNLARYVFKSGNVLADGHWMNANGPIALETDTLICSLGFIIDPELKGIDTPHGHLDFLQLVGLTEDEELAGKTWNVKSFLDVLLPHMPLWITDLHRASLMTVPSVAEKVQQASLSEPSSNAYLYTDVLQLGPLKRLFRPSVMTITMGAGQVSALLAALPRRLPFGLEFTFASPDATMICAAGNENSYALQGTELRLQLSGDALRTLQATLLPIAGTYPVPGFADLQICVRKTHITDQAGKTVKTIG